MWKKGSFCFMQTVESKRRLSLVQAFRSFIAIIPTHLSCQMYASTPGVEFIRTISKYRKRKKISLSLVYILAPWNVKLGRIWFSHHSRAMTVMTCAKKRVTHVQSSRLFCVLNLMLFFTCSLPSSSLDLKVPSKSGKVTSVGKGLACGTER